MLLFNAYAQKTYVTPLSVGERVPDLPIHSIFNYRDTAAMLSSFGGKLVILDFWGVHCTTCISMFPKEDSLQHLFRDSLQFVLVTVDSLQKVDMFLNKWNSHRERPLSIPVVTNDRLLYQLFPFKFIPHYVWLMPNGTLLAQTSEDFIDEAVIRTMLKAVNAKEQELKEDGFGEEMFRFPKMTPRQKLQYTPFLKPNL